MRIFFDYQAFEMQRFGGVSHSYAELISHLQKNNEFDYKIGLKESDNIHLKECGFASKVKPLRYTHNRYFKRKKWIIGQRTISKSILKLLGHNNYALDINKEYCIKLLKHQHFDIFEPTYFDSYFLSYLKDKPFVLTVHDMIPELLGVDKLQAKQKKLLCPLATHIHVPSEKTKNDLVKIMNIVPEKITVIPHGAPMIPRASFPSPYPFPYILYVGARWSYKNFDLFIEECSIVIKQYPEIHIVCTGSAFTDIEKKLIADKKLSNNIVQIYASEKELQTLYQNAVVFVYPSAYEGFGMPILEAWSCGCPVMLNNASCFPEVGGDAAIYFDIDRRGDLAEHIISFYKSSSNERNALIYKGNDRLSQFSWEKSAMLLKQVYNNIS